MNVKRYLFFNLPMIVSMSSSSSSSNLILPVASSVLPGCKTCGTLVLPFTNCTKPMTNKNKENKIRNRYTHAVTSNRQNKKIGAYYHASTTVGIEKQVTTVETEIQIQINRAF